MCRVLKVSASGYYAWRDRAPSKRAIDDAVLVERIRAIHAESDATYGMPRVRAELIDQGVKISGKRVARLMRLHAIRGVSRRRGFIVTTRRDQRQRPAPDLVKREFVAGGPNELWVADMSAPCRRGLQRQREGSTRRSANRSWLIHDRQLQCCLAPVEAGRKGAAKLGRLPTAGCHAQSSLNCTEQGRLRPVRRATTRSMVRQRSVRWKPLYLATPRPRDGYRGAIRLGLMFPSGGCARAHSAMEFLPQPSSRATRGRARHLRT
jgi:hypothetical protein